MCLPLQEISYMFIEGGASQFYENLTHLSTSTPDILTALSDDLPNIESLKEKALAVYRVKQGVNASDPQDLSLEVTHGDYMWYVEHWNVLSLLPQKLKVGDEVHVLDSSSEMWYGVCEDKCGYFDSKYVKLVEILVSHMKRTSVAAVYTHV